MRAVLAALFIATPAAAAGTAYCDERCADRFVQCSTPCAADPKCAQRCQDQMDQCRNTCTSNRQLVDPTKCFDKDGKLTRCDKIQPPSPKPLDATAPGKTAKKSPHGGGSDRSAATR
jgi:hypothetical protein